jgi:hypothetical protein
VSSFGLALQGAWMLHLKPIIEAMEVHFNADAMKVNGAFSGIRCLKKWDLCCEKLNKSMGKILVPPTAKLLIVIDFRTPLGETIGISSNYLNLFEF